MTPSDRDTGWYKSTRSGAANEACVEVRITDTTIGIRHSKNPAGPSCAFSPATWHTFLDITKAGRVDVLG